MSEYCCAGMLKGRSSGIIVAYDEVPMVAVRLAADDRSPDLQPYLILNYCPSCGARLPNGDAETEPAGLSPIPAAPGRLLTFPDVPPMS